MNHKKLAKRYRYLWTGEAVNIVLFSFLLLFFAWRDGEWSRWILRGYSVGVVVVILAEGVVWWRWKLRLLQAGRRDMPERVLRRYARLRRVNWLLIAGFLLAVLVKWWLVGQPPLDRDLWFGLLILGGAVLEQINYFYVQLMYDSRYDWNHLRAHKRLRTGTVAKQLARQEAARAAAERGHGASGSERDA